MLETILLFLMVSGLAFTVGFAIRRGSICAVAAADQWVMHGRTTRIRAFLTAACWAGAVILPAAWALPNWAVLSPGYPISAFVLIGGAVFGIGAYVNGACAFGTLAHLAGGETNYLGTVAGVVAGAVAAPLVLGSAGMPVPSAFADASAVTVIAFAGFLIVAARATWRHYRAQGRKRLSDGWVRSTRRWRPATAMVVIGIAGGLLHAVAGEWTYMAVLSARAARLIDPTFPGTAWPALAGTAALLVGGILAALLSDRFKLTRPRFAPLTKKFLGGALMSFAAAIIPGGNDVLLLHGLPSLAPHAIAAYAAMMGTLIGLFYVRRLRSQ